MEDVLADVVVIALAGNFLDDDAEEQEAIVAVVPLRAGLEFERAALVEVDVVLEEAELADRLHRGPRFIDGVVKFGTVHRGEITD